MVRSWALHFSVAVILFALVAWRAAWLIAGVPDSTDQAEPARALAVQASESDSFRISFADVTLDSNGPFKLQRVGTETWDPNAAVWITPGEDQQPGWATWDDNGNGEIDEPAELGAAWSDDFCVVEHDGQMQQPSGRIIDRGAYVPFLENGTTTKDKATSGKTRSPWGVRLLYRLRPTIPASSSIQGQRHR